MELPVEIIYEISCHIPFESYVWILSKTTNKYWNDRFLDLDKVVPEDVGKRPIFATLGRPKDPEKGKIIEKIIPHVRFLILTKKYNDYLTSKTVDLVELIPESKIQAIYLSGHCANNLVEVSMPDLKFFNYRLTLSESDLGMIEREYPEYLGLMEKYCDDLKGWSRMDYRRGDYIWNLELVKNRDTSIVTCIGPALLTDSTLMELSDNLEIELRDEDDITIAIEELEGYPHIKTCKFRTYDEDTYTFCCKAIEGLGSEFSAVFL